jgi:aldehyde dehydrogenase (NAD+)
MKVAEIFETMVYGPAPEAAGPALAWLDRHDRTFGHFIGGAFVSGTGHFDSVNPATGKTLARIAQATGAEVDAAVAAARAALPGWNALPGHQRARFLYALARQVQKHSRLLAVLETLENGKPIRSSSSASSPATLPSASSARSSPGTSRS